MKALCLHTNIYRRKAVYYVRKRVPTDLLGVYAPKKEIAYSLKTKDPEEAKRLGRLALIKLDQQFEADRRALEAAYQSQQAAPGHPAPARAEVPLSQPEIERLALLYYHAAMKADADEQHKPKDPAALAKEQEEANQWAALYGSQPKPVNPFGLTPGETAAKRGRAELFLQAAPLFLANNDFSTIEDTAASILKAQHLDPPKLDPSYHQFCQAIFEAECRIQQAVLQRLKGELQPQTEGLALSMRAVSNQQNGKAGPEPAGPDNPPLSDIFKRYLKERNPAAKTVSDFSTHIRRFIEVNGDLPVGNITKAHIREFKDAMLKMPVSRGVPREIMDLPVQRLIKKMEKYKKGTSYPTLSARTVKEKCLAAVRTILSYAVGNGYIEHNPVTGITVIDNRNKIAEPARLPYDIDDLKQIFSSPLFVGGGNMRMRDIEKKADYQWLVLLALFTGARLEELGQLDVKDVEQENGIWAIFIRADLESGRSIKNAGSRRKVPVHPDLVGLGFIEFVLGLPEDGKVFRHISSARTQRTSAFSTWWGRYCKEIGVHTNQKTFHSFRHTFKQVMRNSGANMEHVDAIQGHSDGGSSSGQYGRDMYGMKYSVSVLMETMKMLKFEGLELGGLDLDARHAITA